MPYQTADTHDNEAGYATVDPQPYTIGIFYPEYRHTAGGLSVPAGAPFCWLEWENLTPTEATSLLTQYGLTTATTNDVTHSLPDDDRSTFSDYNATAIHERTEEYRLFRDHLYRRFRIKLIKLTDT